MINALRLTFPDSKRLLCEWHVQKNVISNIDGSFKKGDEKLQDQFMVDWAGVLASTTRADFDENWDTLFDKYHEAHENLVWYLKNTWLVFKWNLIQI